MQVKLSERDKAIMNFIRRQDFFYRDVVKFFSSYSTASRRLKDLSKYGYVVIEDIRSRHFKKHFR